jgi:molecular chaperone DnaK (HSP70)
MSNSTRGSSKSICPSCGKLSRVGAQFCRRCGTRLTSDESVEGASVRISPETTCPTCGYTLNPGMTFCNQCGTRLDKSRPDDLSQLNPEPIRRLSLQMKRIERFDVSRTRLSTVTGLDIGRTNSYLAFARMKEDVLTTKPKLVRFDAQAAIPSLVRLPGKGLGAIVGVDAVTEWEKQPSGVHIGFMDKFGTGDASTQSVALSFLETVARRLVEVSTPEILIPSRGGVTVLGVPAGWADDRIELLVNTAIEAGFPVNRVVPKPIAAVAHHLQLGTLKSPADQEIVMVVDWGWAAVQISFVEYGKDIPEPVLFEHIQVSPGGRWYDNALMDVFVSQLPSELSDLDRRQLILFTRSFKERLSKSFARGKSEHAEYCVIPAGAPPTRICMRRVDFEALHAESHKKLRNALLESIAAIGLQPSFIDHVILVGGGANWYFARETFRKILGHVPLIGPHPEEAIARGLVACEVAFKFSRSRTP